MRGRLSRPAKAQDLNSEEILWNPRSDGCGIRLSTDPSRSLPTTDQTAKTVLYLVPHKSDIIELWDGDDWVPRHIPYDLSSAASSSPTRKRTSLDISGTANAATYDVYVKWVGNGPELKWVPWRNTTVRFAVPTGQADFHPDGLGLFQGRLVQAMPDSAASPFASGGLRPEWLYLGTFYTSAAGQVEDSTAKRFLWNVYNRVIRQLRYLAVDANWTYASATVRQANNSTAYGVACVTGLNQFAHVEIHCGYAAPGAATDYEIGVGVDSTTTFHTDGASDYSNVAGPLGASLDHAALGYRKYSWNEHSVSAGAGATVYGDMGAERLQSGLFGEILA